MAETQTTTTLERSTGARTMSLGQLLQAHREATQLDIGDVSTATSFGVDTVRAVEADTHSLELAELADLLDGYGDVVPGNLLTGTTLEVNLEEAWISLSWATSPTTFEDRPADRVLARYLSLLYAQRTLPMGSQVSIREVDLTLLRNSLALRTEAVTDRIGQMDLGPSDDPERGRIVLLAALVCATGALLLSPGGPAIADADQVSPPEAIASVEVKVEIGTAVSITREPVTAEATSQSPVSDVVQVEIGTAAVEER